MTLKPILLLSSQFAGNTNEEDKGDCDCDCACSSSSGFVSDISISSNLALSIPDLYSQQLTDKYSLWFNPHNNADIAVLNSSAVDILESFRAPRKINESDDTEIINKMISSGLLSIDRVNQQRQNEVEPQVLSAWLHVTDRCNLRCTYCYLPHVREDMSLETGYAAIDSIFRSAIANKFQQVKLKYAGGESLLRYSLILELHDYAKNLAEENGVILEEVVLSNGTLLTDEMAKELKSLNIRLMISMDGMGHYHDSQRPYAGGRGSFKDVSDSVDRALLHGLIPTISVTISSRTAEGLPHIMEWILERELPFSLNFYRENELSLAHIDMKIDEQKIINGMKAAFEVIENNLPQRSLLGGIIDKANLSASHTHTCGVGKNYLVFDQNGQIAKCQMHIRKPITNIKVDDPLQVIKLDQIGIQNISVNEKEGCKTCEWKYWCTGGCPLATFQATGRYDVKSPNCNIYKSLYPEALKLEGKRLLKYMHNFEQ